LSVPIYHSNMDLSLLILSFAVVCLPVCQPREIGAGREAAESNQLFVNYVISTRTGL
jgi:hypothetical protein